MEWGLEGIQLSHKNPAFYLVYDTSDGLLDQILGWLGWDKEAAVRNSFAMLSPQPVYDFYLPRDVNNDNLISREYDGYNMNCDIIKFLLSNYTDDDVTKLNEIKLTEDTKSALSYCYNKNKRDASGNVCMLQNNGNFNSQQLKWYLPSIDEIEDIAQGAYDEFDRVFQGNKYWSCQPSYHQNKLVLDLYRGSYSGLFQWAWYDSGSDFNGPYYEDDITRARATRALAENGQFAGNISSGSDLYKERYGIIYAAATHSKDAHLTPERDKIINSTPYSGHEGNLSRTDKCRIRAVYRSGKK